VTRPSVIGRPPIKLFSIGTEAAKDSFVASLRVEEQGPAYCHFPMQPIYDSEYFKQLLSERPVMSRGHRVWKKIREALRNEALDCRVYAMAAYHILNPNLKRTSRRLLETLARPNTDRQTDDSEPEQAQQYTDRQTDDSESEFQIPSQKSRRNPTPRRRGGFVNNW
jgi:phage terminase large subunit GpA-like protein